MSYLDRIKASYQAGKADTIAAREKARKRAAEKRAAATQAARQAPPIRAVRAAGRIIEGARPAITGAQKVTISLGKLSKPSPSIPQKNQKYQKIQKKNLKIQPKKSMLW